MIFAECHINYRAPVAFDEEVEVRCWIGEVRRSACEVRFEMHVGERMVAEGFGWLVGFDYASGDTNPASRNASRAAKYPRSQRSPNPPASRHR